MVIALVGAEALPRAQALPAVLRHRLREVDQVRAAERAQPVHKATNLP